MDLTLRYEYAPILAARAHANSSRGSEYALAKRSIPRHERYPNSGYCRLFKICSTTLAVWRPIVLALAIILLGVQDKCS